MYKKNLAAVCQALVCRDVKRFFKEDVGTSLKPSCTNYTLRCSIHDHSSETSSLYHPSFPLIHGDRAVLAEPLVLLPSGLVGGEVKWGQANKAKPKTQQHWQWKTEMKEKTVSLCLCNVVRFSATGSWMFQMINSVPDVGGNINQVVIRCLDK